MNDAPFVAVTETPRATAAALLGRQHVHSLHLRLGGPAELPGGDDERGQKHHRDHGDRDEARLALLPLAPAAGLDTTRAQWMLLLACDVAGVVLVDVELAVHPEGVGIGPQEALDVRVARKLLELLRFERAKVLRPHLRAELHLVEVEALARPGLAKA